MKRRSFLASTLASTLSLSFLAARRANAEEKEPVSMPDFPIVDTHVHFWDPGHLDYGWIQGSEILNKPCLPEDYTRALGPVRVEKLVFVQAECRPDQATEEARWVAGLAEKDARIQGIVASAPLELGDAVTPTLEQLAELSPMRGIRRLLQSDPDQELCVRPGFVEGTRRLAKFGLSFDFGINRRQLGSAATLAREVPEVRFMVDHLAFPDIAGGTLDPWREDLRALSELPNVFCKMSGVATAARHEDWRPADLRPAIEHAIDCFGFDRIAFGSDWPVMLLATQYPQWVEALSWVVTQASDSERQKLFRITAEAFYRL